MAPSTASALPSTRSAGPETASWALVAARALRWVALGLIGFVGFLAIASQAGHARAQATAYRDFRLAIAQQVAPLGGAIAPGTPVAYLQIPSLSVGQVVLEGTSSEITADGPGHRRDTVLPGQAGVSVVAGRRAAYGGAFWKLARLRPGARIDVFTQQGAMRFTVDRVRRDGDPAPPALAAGASRLTLATADGRPFLPSRAVFVDATLQGPARAGVSPVASLLPSEGLMSGDTAAALPLALWSQALLAVVLAAGWLRRRWGRWQTYITVVPVVLVVLWNVYDTGARLLPAAL